MDFKLNFQAVVFPIPQIVATCGECGAELARQNYSGYHDYNLQKSILGKRIVRCTYCQPKAERAAEKGNAPKWQREPNGDWLAKALNGDFLIWRYGNSFKWRYRGYGKQAPDVIGFSKTVDGAKQACEKHKQWRGCI